MLPAGWSKAGVSTLQGKGTSDRCSVGSYLEPIQCGMGGHPWEQTAQAGSPKQLCFWRRWGGTTHPCASRSWPGWGQPYSLVFCAGRAAAPWRGSQWLVWGPKHLDFWVNSSPCVQSSAPGSAVPLAEHEAGSCVLGGGDPGARGRSQEEEVPQLSAKEGAPSLDSSYYLHA